MLIYKFIFYLIFLLFYIYVGLGLDSTNTYVTFFYDFLYFLVPTLVFIIILTSHYLRIFCHYFNMPVIFFYCFLNPISYFLDVLFFPLCHHFLLYRGVHVQYPSQVLHVAHLTSNIFSVVFAVSTLVSTAFVNMNFKMTIVLDTHLGT